MYLPYYNDTDRALVDMLGFVRLMEGVDTGMLQHYPNAAIHTVSTPDEEYAFLHEAAVIRYHGTLFASWYNCPEKELIGITPIRGRRSKDDGKTWGDIEVLAADESGKILYCPPVYGIENDTLYMFVNQMVAPDCMHALDLYVFDEEADAFRLLWSRPIPFKLNTNVVRLANGKLMLPGRIGELDGLPETPAVLISDTGHIDAEWRVVPLQKDRYLPDGERFEYPETAVFTKDNNVYLFARHDRNHVPLIYLSEDNGEHWVGPYAHNIPFSTSKIYAGTLSNGKNYVIGNLYPDRARLAIFFTAPGALKFTEGYILADAYTPGFENSNAFHYPVAYEEDGKLFVIFTNSYKDGTRGADLAVLPII